jgi:hypothetical protein
MYGVRPISFSIKAIEEPATFTEGYMSEVVVSDDELVCDVCADAGWYRPATFETLCTFQWTGEESTTDDGYVCHHHLTDLVENFRDIGK